MRYALVAAHDNGSVEVHVVARPRREHNSRAVDAFQAVSTCLVAFSANHFVDLHGSLSKKALIIAQKRVFTCESLFFWGILKNNSEFHAFLRVPKSVGHREKFLPSFCHPVPA